MRHTRIGKGQTVHAVTPNNNTYCSRYVGGTVDAHDTTDPITCRTCAKRAARKDACEQPFSRK